MNRADRMLAVLVDGQWHSRAELHAAGGFYLTNNAASELRDRDLEVVQHVEVIDGKRVWFYRLISGPTELPESDAAGDWGRQASSDSGSAGDVGLPAVTSSTDSSQFTGDLVRRPHPSPLSAGDPRAANRGDDLSPPEIVSPALSDDKQLNLLEAA